MAERMLRVSFALTSIILSIIVLPPCVNMLAVPQVSTGFRVGLAPAGRLLICRSLSQAGGLFLLALVFFYTNRRRLLIAKLQYLSFARGKAVFKVCLGLF